MSFRIGQRVRAIACLNQTNMKYVGAIGTICSTAYMNEWLPCQDVRWETDCPFKGRIGKEPIMCLEPIDDPSAFDTFMERVLKPVPLPVEIEA